MKIGLFEFVHRMVFLLITIAFTFLFFYLLDILQSNADKLTVAVIGIFGFIVLGRYDIRQFNGKWW